MKLVKKLKTKLQKQKNQNQQSQLDAEYKRNELKEQIENEKIYEEELLRKVLDPTLEGVYVPEEKQNIEYCETERIL